MLFPKPRRDEYGTSTVSRRLAASVLRPEPHTIPTRGLRKFSGNFLFRISRVAENGRFDMVKKLVICMRVGVKVGVMARRWW